MGVGRQSTRAGLDGSRSPNHGNRNGRSQPYRDGLADKAVAGYLYFPVGDTKATTIELVYQHDGAN